MTPSTTNGGRIVQYHIKQTLLACVQNTDLVAKTQISLIEGTTYKMSCNNVNSNELHNPRGPAYLTMSILGVATGAGVGATGAGVGVTGSGVCATGAGVGVGTTGAGVGATGAGVGATGAGVGRTGEGVGATGAGVGRTGDGVGATGAGVGATGAGVGATGAADTTSTRAASLSVTILPELTPTPTTVALNPALVQQVPEWEQFDASSCWELGDA